MRKFFCLMVSCWILFSGIDLHAQQNVGIGTSSPNASAMLDISSNSKGVLIPRLNKSQRNSISSPAKGLLVFVDDVDSVGFHYYDGGKWVWLLGNDVTDTLSWKRKGNSGINPSQHFIGTTDDQPLSFRQNNTWLGRWDRAKGNYFIGDSAGAKTTTGTGNIVIGDSALFSNTIGSSNIAIGNSALAMSPASGLIAIGDSAGYAINSSLAINNIFLGRNAGRANTSGTTNIFIGTNAGSKLLSGSGNIFIGDSAGASKTTGGFTSSVFVGDRTGARTTGAPNTFIGNFAGVANTTGNNNCFIGTGSGMENISGRYNTFLGENAGFSNLKGNYNTLLGYGANTGSDSLNYATAIGPYAYVDTSNAIVLGAVGQNINVGIGTTKPFYSLHVVNSKTNDGGWAQGIVVENTSTYASAGEAAISFRNAAIPSTKQWNVGINQASSALGFNYGSSFSGGSTRMAIDTFGNVGIGTITPLARLHVRDSSVVFTAPATITFPGGLPPVSGVGNHMMWYADHAAFRAGGTFSDEWDQFNVGFYSIAAGYANKAWGYAAASFGYYNSTGGVASITGGSFNITTQDNATAFGYNNTINGQYSTAIGYLNNVSSILGVALGTQNTVDGNNAVALGSANTSSGAVSLALGNFTRALGDRSTTMGYNTKAKSFASVVIGQWNDTTSSSSSAWTDTDPVFVIGNGSSGTNRSNALTVLKNGKMGLGPTVSPQYTLHVTNDHPGDGGWADGIMIENLSGGGEAGLSFRNNIVPSSRQWTMGLNQNPNFAISYGGSFAGGATKFLIDTYGLVGIGTITPQNKLHVVNNNAASGGASEGILVENINATTGEAAIGFRNTGTNGSGTKQWFIGMNETRDFSWGYGTNFDGTAFRMLLDSTGQLGIGTSSPAALLDVDGTTKLGTNGTSLTEVIKLTVNKDVAAIAANASGLETFAVANSQLNSTVYVSPAVALADGLIIAYARVSIAGTVEVKFVNTTAGIINPTAMNFFITVIR